MNSLPDNSFRITSLPESEPTAYVKNRVRLGELAKPTEDYVDGKVRLDCNGEVADIASIGAFVTWRSAPGMALVEFVCSRCNRLHESMSIAAHPTLTMSPRLRATRHTGLQVTKPVNARGAIANGWHGAPLL